MGSTFFYYHKKLLKNHIFVNFIFKNSKIVPLISNVIETLCISWFSLKNKLVKFIDPYSQNFLEYDQSNSGQKYIYLFFFKICITLCKVHDSSLLGWSYLVCAGIHVPCAPRLGHGIPCPCLRPRPPIHLGATKGG